MGARVVGEMSNLWPRVEPLLAEVEKPARYIGLERGSRQPRWAPHKAAWLLIYPDTYEIGLPNQGLQILYEILNERDDALAERTYAPWIDLAGAMRGRGVPLFSVDTHRSARRLRRPRVQPVGRAGVHQRPRARRPGGRAGPQRGPRRRASARARGRPLRLQPRAARRLRRRVRDRRRRGARRRDQPRSSAVSKPSGREPQASGGGGARTAAPRARDRSPASTCRRCTTSPTTAGTSPR